MELAKGLLKKKEGRSTNLSSHNESISNKSRANSTKYHDYLTERRKDRNKSGIQKAMNRTEDGGIKDRFIRRDVEEVEKIMKSGNLHK